MGGGDNTLERKELKLLITLNAIQRIRSDKKGGDNG